MLRQIMKITTDYIKSDQSLKSEKENIRILVRKYAEKIFLMDKHCQNYNNGKIHISSSHHRLPQLQCVSA